MKAFLVILVEGVGKDVGYLAWDVLVDGAAEGDVDDLVSAADAKYRFSEPAHGVEELDFACIASIAHCARVCVFPAVKRGVDVIGSAGEDDAVEAFGNAVEFVRFFDQRYQERQTAACPDELYVVNLDVLDFCRNVKRSFRIARKTNARADSNQRLHKANPGLVLLCCAGRRPRRRVASQAKSKPLKKIYPNNIQTNERDFTLCVEKWM